MKFKIIHLYALLAFIIIIVLIISSQQSTVTDNTSIINEQMPGDDIHKEFTNPMSQSPGTSNVTSETIQKLETLKKAVDASPDDTLRIREYADFLSMAHKSKDAIQFYEKILSKDNNRIDILFSLTFIYYNEGNMNKAEELTRKVLTIDPKNEMAIYNTGAIEASRGNRERAREIWTKLIEDFPGSETSDLAKNSLNRL